MQVVESAALAAAGVQVDDARAVLHQQRARVQAALARHAPGRDACVATDFDVLRATVVQSLVLHALSPADEKLRTRGATLA